MALFKRVIKLTNSGEWPKPAAAGLREAVPCPLYNDFGQSQVEKMRLAVAKLHPLVRKGDASGS